MVWTHQRLIKRFHDCLLPTHDQVVKTYKEIEGLAVKDAFLRRASGYRFYNTSEYTFEKLKADPENIKVNFEAYLNGFSDNVMDILSRMDFFTQLERMSNAGLLYQVISDFCSEKADMNPEKISAVDMGYIFENLVQKFSESYDEEAGAHGKDAFEFRENAIVVKIPFNWINVMGNKLGSKVGNKVGDKSVSGEEQNIHLNETQLQILNYIRDNNNITKKQLQEKTQKSKTTVDNTISFLKENGLLERIGSNKTGYWKVND